MASRYGGVAAERTGSGRKGMNKAARLLAVALLSMLAAGASAGEGTSTILELYPRESLTPLPVPEQRDEFFSPGALAIRNVSYPTIELFRPAKEKANGTAIVVVPGGGFLGLAYDVEGTATAKRLADAGIMAIVVKYRVGQTSPDLAKAKAELWAVLGPVLNRAKTGDPEELPRFATEDLAAADAAQALRLVRAKATEWGIDPKRIGMMGFSAGAITSANLAIGDPASRPDFVGLIYGGLRGPVPADAPPAFIASAADDLAFRTDSVRLFLAWQAAGRPVELHMFEAGNHGFLGLSPNTTTSAYWFDEFVWWMTSRGLMSTAPAVEK
jgi:acetyl esterase/lipase